MVRKSGMAFASMLALVIGIGALAAEDKKASIEGIMKAIAGKKGLCAKCGAAGKDGKWEDAQKFAKDLAKCAGGLADCPCPKGDGASWKKLSKAYGEQAEAVSKAAEEKDSKAFSAALKTFTSNCKGCHDAHK